MRFEGRGFSRRSMLSLDYEFREAARRVIGRLTQASSQRAAISSLGTLRVCIDGRRGRADGAAPARCAPFMLSARS